MLLFSWKNRTIINEKHIKHPTTINKKHFKIFINDKKRNIKE